MSFLIKLFFGGCFVYMLITYGIRRVLLLNFPESAAPVLNDKNTASLITEDKPLKFTGRALLFFILEYFYLCVHIFLLLVDYVVSPFRLISKKNIPPCEHDVQPPVILIHGYMMRGGVLWPMLRRLKRDGFKQVSLFTYEKPWRDIAYFAEQLADEVERITSHCKVKKVDLVAHSMGGLVARYYINYLGGDERVERLVTLGTPHNGTYLWALAGFKSGAQMRPGSRFLTYLAENDDKLQKVSVRSIYCDFDELVIPVESPVMEGKNIIHRKIPDLGHVGLVYHRLGYQEVEEALRRKVV